MAKLGDGKQTFDFDKLQQDAATPPKTKAICLYGPPNYGKSTFALTWSDFHPGMDNLPKSEEDSITLEDGFLCQFDTGGNEFLGPQNLHIPGVHIQDAMGDKLTEGRLRQYLTGLVAHIKQRAADGITKFVIIDGLSTLDNLMYASTNIEPPTCYQHVGRWHMSFFRDLISLPCDVMIVAHSKEVNKNPWHTDPKLIAQDAAKRKAKALPGDPDIQLALQGNMAQHYYWAQFAWILPVMTQGIGKDMKRYIYTGQPKDFVVKTKDPGLPEKMQSLKPLKKATKEQNND